ncbi:MAG: hypothetical protein AABW63_02040 [Nanoarchaeota archaeon]
MAKKKVNWDLIYKIAAIIVIVAGILWIIFLIFGKPVLSGNVAASCLSGCYDISEHCPSITCYDESGKEIKCDCWGYFNECVNGCYPGATKASKTAA